MGSGGRIGDTLRVPGRGVRRVLVVAVVLVLAGALGGAVALTAPLLLARVRTGQAVAMLPPVPARVLGPLAATAPAPTAARLAAVLDPMADAMPGRFTGTVLDPTNGTALWTRSAEKALASGSTVKLLTASAALLSLDPTGTLVTRVVAGPTPGTVVLIGGGDPSLTALPAGRTGLYPDPARLRDLATAVRAATAGTPITKVVVDTSRYTGPTMAAGWDPADIAGGDITPIGPLMLDGGRLDPTELDGARTPTPAQAAGRALAGLLGADPDTVVAGRAAPDAKLLGSVSSAPISDLVENLVQISDNVTAEVLARETALKRGGDPSFTGAVTQTLAALAEAGIDPAGAALADGSGLSTADRVPATLLGSILATAAAPGPAAPDAAAPDAAAPAGGSPDPGVLRPILSGLPVAGGDGTLDDRFAPGADSAAGRGVVRAKTGTLTGVSSLAGLVTDRDGRLLVFAFMSNGASPAEVRPRLDDIAANLSGCGCR